MSAQPLNPSPDIQRLINEGYEVEIKGAFLLVSHVPYVDSNRTVRYGTLVSQLAVNADQIIKSDDHVIHFIGEHPCFKDGSIMQPIKHPNPSQTRELADGIVINHSFSNKPPGGYPDYYQKLIRYVTMISVEARAIKPTVTAITFRVIESTAEECVFHYRDTNSSRAEIDAISDKLKGHKVALVGVGGTGSYVLDAVAKTLVAEIHLHDGDTFDQHNAFRAPGAPSLDQLRERPFKANYFADIYSRMRSGIHVHAEPINVANVAQLLEMDFVFICVDHGPTKGVVIPFLEAHGKPFIDVGMGVRAEDGQLHGMIRTTLSTPSKRDHVASRVSFHDEADGAYKTNIQIAELNMLNAANAVIRWKKLLGFYHDANHEHNSTYTISANTLCSSAEA